MLVELLFPDVLYKLWAKFLVTAADQNFKNRTHTTHNTVSIPMKVVIVLGGFTGLMIESLRNIPSSETEHVGRGGLTVKPGKREKLTDDRVL